MSVLNVIRDTVAEVTGIRAVPDILQHPRDANVETLKIPAYCQTQSFSCGFVAGLMVLRYFFPDARAEAFYASVNADPETGTSEGMLTRALRRHGVSVSVRHDLTFAALAAAIDRGRPLAMIVNTSCPDYSHWVVAYGYGRHPSRVYVAGNGLPIVSRKVYCWQEFQAYHWRTPGQGLVCFRGKPRKRGSVRKTAKVISK